VQGGGDIAEGGDVQLLHRPTHHFADVPHRLTREDGFFHQGRAFLDR
jgi:hypothetical protein